VRGFRAKRGRGDTTDTTLPNPPPHAIFFSVPHSSKFCFIPFLYNLTRNKANFTLKKQFSKFTLILLEYGTEKKSPPALRGHIFNFDQARIQPL
jgi:hypothetical protein